MIYLIVLISVLPVKYVKLTTCNDKLKLVDVASVGIAVKSTRNYRFFHKLAKALPITFTTNFSVKGPRLQTSNSDFFGVSASFGFHNVHSTLQPNSQARVF